MGVLRAEREQSALKLDELAEQLADAKLQLATATTPKRDGPKLDEYLSAEKIAAIGEDKAAEILELAHRVASEEVERRVKEAIKPMQEREERRSNQRHQEERQRVLRELTEAVPDWEAVNASDEWKDYCLEFDRELGEKRQAVIERAMRTYESGPLIALFRKFDTTQAPPAVPPGSKPPVVPREAAGGGNTPPAPTPPGDPDAGPLTRAKVRELYTNLAKRRDLSAAQREAESKKLDERVRRAQESGELR